MHGTLRTRHPEPPVVLPVQVAQRRNAAIWIVPGMAMVVRDLDGGGTDTLEVGLPAQYAAMPPALAAVAHHVARAHRVLIMGEAELRTALEREIVAIGHRPDAIRETAADGPIDRDVLLRRLRRLA